MDEWMDDKHISKHMKQADISERLLSEILVFLTVDGNSLRRVQRVSCSQTIFQFIIGFQLFIWNCHVILVGLWTECHNFLMAIVRSQCSAVLAGVYNVWLCIPLSPRVLSRIETFSAVSATFGNFSRFAGTVPKLPQYELSVFSAISAISTDSAENIGMCRNGEFIENFQILDRRVVSSWSLMLMAGLVYFYRILSVFFSNDILSL